MDVAPQPPEQTAEEVEAIRAGIQRATRATMFAVPDCLRANRAALDECTPADRNVVTVQAVIAYLAGQGLITVAPVETYDRALPSVIAEPYLTDLHGRLYEGVYRARGWPTGTRQRRSTFWRLVTRFLPTPRRRRRTADN